MRSALAGGMLVLDPMDDSNTEHATFPRGLPRSGLAVWAQNLTKTFLTAPPDPSYKALETSDICHGMLLWFPYL